MRQFSCMSKYTREKSPCCRAAIYKFGGKRRQCSLCKKTWTVWPKKRGRTPLRPRHNLLRKTVTEKQSLVAHRKRWRHLTLGAWSVRLRSAMERFLDSTGPNSAPDGPLILVIDALWFWFKQKRWTMYLAVARAVDSDRATILDPVLLPGRENYDDWSTVIGDLPESVKIRVKALVCDGFRGTDRIARDNRWIVQRCHFHLLSQMQVNRGKWKQLPDSPQREAVYLAIRKVLNTGPAQLARCVQELTVLLVKNNCPKRLGAIGREFLRRLDHFRSYRNFPELHLPNTTNTVESLNKVIRSHCKHLRTPESLERRTKVLIRMRKTMTCKPKIFQQN